MTADVPGLAPCAQETLTGWHRFVETKSEDVLRPLLAETTVFRSPFVHLPIPGRPASLLILGAVVQIFENFRYHRTFVAGSHDVALEFSATIGDLQLKGIDLVKFDSAGKIIEFEVMIRPFKALEALSTRMSARIGPELAKYKPARAVSA
ncbi:nuclear transport factor 2 family protein [Afipia sp. DC4300-2b1]|uniref:nuclear transport factor 2 family protein n=1 Tax=Afipia sp. DC4300-2b1 TaxID=2804672 RepID=UPI003CEBC52C